MENTFYIQNKKTHEYFKDFESLDSHSAKALNNFTIKITTTKKREEAKSFTDFDNAFNLMYENKKLRNGWEVVMNDTQAGFFGNKF